MLVTEDVGLGEVAEHGGDGDAAVVGGFGAESGVRSLDGLPGRVAVVGALVHVDAADADRGAVEVEIDAPEGGAESVREAWCTFVVERVGLAENEGKFVLGEE